MNKIESFQVDHMRLLPGIYVSRKDKVGEKQVTTFDIRITRPNFEPVLNTGEIHAIEHICATFLRNNKEYADKIVYFGPMGCRTGFYMILNDDYESKDVVELVQEIFKFVMNFEDDIPGASKVECGNYLDLNLPMAKFVSKKYYEEILCNLTDENLNYPA